MQESRLIMFLALAILLANLPTQAVCGDDDLLHVDHATSAYEIITGTYEFGGLDQLGEVPVSRSLRAFTAETAASNHDVRLNFETVIPVESVVFSLNLQLEGFIFSSGRISPSTAGDDKLFNWTTSKFDEIVDADNIPANLYAEPGTGKVLLQVSRSYANETLVLFDVVTWVSSSVTFETTASAPLTAVNSGDFVDSGSLVSGALSNVFFSDNNNLVYESQNNASVVLDFSAELCEAEPDNPGSLVLQLETRVDTPNVEQIVSFYNWQSGQYDQIKNSTEGVIDQVQTIDISDTVFEHVRASTGSVRWRIQWKPTGNTNSSWRVEVDQAVLLTEKSAVPVGWDFFGHQELRFQELLAEFPDKNAETIKQLHSDYVTGYPAINAGFWLNPIDFSGTSWAEFVGPNENGVLNSFLDARISFNDYRGSPTLIAPQVITFAWHSTPIPAPNEDQIWFGTDGNTEPTLVTEIHQVSGTDIGIGKLANPIQNSTVKQYKIAAFHSIEADRFKAGGELEDAKVILADQRGKVFLGKITAYGLLSSGNSVDNLYHTRITNGDYPSETIIAGDSSNPLYLLTPDDELILVSSHSTAGFSPMVGRYLDEINEHIQSPSGFNLPDQAVEAYDLRTPFVFRGDLDRDGAVTFDDISPFITALAGSSYEIKADMNQDGQVDFSDVAPFIILLATP